MRIWLAMLLLALAVSAGLALTAQEAREGFVSRFDGKSLAGWQVAGNPEGFRVVEGCLHSDGGKGGEWIHTTRQYGNFVLRLDWMLSKTGNSGVFIRQGGERPGCEVQLLAPWTPWRDDLHCTGSLYGHVPANPRPDERTLRWRTLEVTAAYQRITVKIDGKQCAQADYDQVPSMQELARAGFVGMQDSHTGPGEWVRFRNIRIKDLDADPGFLCQGLSEPGPATRRLAYEAVLRLGPPMVGPLLELAGKGTAEARQAAEQALERMAAAATRPGAEGERKAVVRALAAGAASNGELVARLLGLVVMPESPPDPGLRALERLLAAGGRTGIAALQAAGRIPGAGMTQVLLAALGQAREADQPALLLALGARRDEAAFPALAQRAQKGAGEVQLAAIRALGLLGSARAVPVLREIGLGSQGARREKAVEALITLLDSRGLEPRAREQALAIARLLAVTPSQKRAVGAE